MKMITIPTFTHHLLPMLHAGKSEIKASKDIRHNVERIEGPLRLAVRKEIAIVQLGTDFLDLSPGMAAARRAAIQTMGQTPNLCWLALTAMPENIGAVAKEGSFGACAKNLCIGLIATDMDGLDENVEQLGLLRCEHKMLMLHSLKEPPDLDGKLTGLDWLVLCTTAENAGWSEDARHACQAADIAFLHLNQDETSAFHSSPNSNFADASDNEEVWREHPFGPKVLLRRPTLKGWQPPDRFSIDLSCAEQQEAPEAAEEPCPPATVAATVANASDIAPAVSAEQTVSPPPDPITINPQVEAAMDAVELPAEHAAAAKEEDITEDATIVCEEEEPGSSEACAEDTTAPVETSFIVSNAEAPLLTCTIDPGQANNTELAEFHRLNEIVAKGIESFVEAGMAFMEIRDRKLWKAAGFQTWDEYCEQTNGLTRQYVNRLIKAASTLFNLRQVETIVSSSPECLPQNEAQLKELYRIKDPEKQAVACLRAVERTQGPMTAIVLRDAVAEIMAEEDAPPKVRKPGRKELLAQSFESLRAAVSSEASQEELLAMIKVTEGLAR